MFVFPPNVGLAVFEFTVGASVDVVIVAPKLIDLVVDVMVPKD